MCTIKKHRKRRSDEISTIFLVVVFICTSPLLFIFWSQGQEGRGMIAWVLAMVIVAVAKLFWELRRSVWFWVAVFVIIVIHIPIVVLIPWPNSHSRGSGYFAIALPDFFLVHWIFRMVEKNVSKRKKDIGVNGE
jgi:hypothetical protein